MSNVGHTNCVTLSKRQKLLLKAGLYKTIKEEFCLACIRVQFIWASNFKIQLYPPTAEAGPLGQAGHCHTNLSLPSSSLDRSAF